MHEYAEKMMKYYYDVKMNCDETMMNYEVSLMKIWKIYTDLFCISLRPPLMVVSQRHGMLWWDEVMYLLHFSVLM